MVRVLGNREKIIMKTNNVLTTKLAFTKPIRNKWKWNKKADENDNQKRAFKFTMR